jgi:predicted metal-dependent peptidase
VRAARLDVLPLELRQRFAAGRVWAAHQAPYLASGLLALDPVVIELDDDDAPVDLSAFPADRRWHLYIDPEVLALTEVPELGFWLLHQVGHLLRSHAQRFPERGSDLDAQPLGGRTHGQRCWNLATDAELDDDLFTEELVLPERAVTPAKLGLPESLTGEEYWDLLPDETRTRRTQTQAARDPAECDCGSGCDGQSRPWDCNRPGLTRAACQRLGRDVARRIRDHVRSRGSVPAGWERWADEILEPTVNWRRELAAQIRRGAADVAGRVDFTYRRPSRRQAALPDVVLPSLRQPLPRVALVIDTSGSMSDGMLGQALGEVGGVLRSLGVARRNLRVICCDADAYEAQSVRDIGRVQLAGGGGTDMGRGVQAAAELRPRPDLVVVLTDGLTPWPPSPPPGIRVVVGLMDETGHSPEWADTVLVGGGRR